MIVKGGENKKYISPNIYSTLVLFFIIILSSYNYPLELEAPHIAKWYNNLNCAVSLRFDDNLNSHVNYVVPMLNKYDIKATFMVNPGRNNCIINYNNNKDFWENELPHMGHRIGNHTWNHNGAANLEEAEYEIGEASKLIWKIFPNESKLNVFASGGGEKWGGERWHRTSSLYKEIPKKYHLIDLYDGKHPYTELNSGLSREKLNTMVDEVIINGTHRSFVFHKIGSKGILDVAKEAITGYNNCFFEDQFLQFVEYLKLNRKQIWVAPIIQIYKYQTEFQSTKLESVVESYREQVFELMIDTDSELYDQKLSLVIPSIKNISPPVILQNDRKIEVIKKTNEDYLAIIFPVNSQIKIKYKA